MSAKSIARGAVRLARPIAHSLSAEIATATHPCIGTSWAEEEYVSAWNAKDRTKEITHEVRHHGAAVDLRTALLRPVVLHRLARLAVELHGEAHLGNVEAVCHDNDISWQLLAILRNDAVLLDLDECGALELDVGAAQRGQVVSVKDTTLAAWLKLRTRYEDIVVLCAWEACQRDAASLSRATSCSPWVAQSS